MLYVLGIVSQREVDIRVVQSFDGELGEILSIR
jgi:hypothetical protein